MGNPQTPQFIQFSDLGIEFVTGRNVELLAGSNLEFVNGYTHAGGYNNFVSCQASNDLHVGPGVSLWSWVGGGIANASGSTVYIEGGEGQLVGAHEVWGSGNQGGTPGQCPGVELAGTAASNIISNNTIGDALHPTWQAEPILLDPGANLNTVTGNAYAGNVANHTVNNAGPGTYNPIRCNAGAINDCYPTLGQTGIPFVIPSSGTMGNNGALAVTTALDYAYPASYVRLPAGAIQTGSAAGWYYAVWSSASTATVYNNVYTSGNPVIPTSPAAFSTTGPGAYTQSTGSNIGAYTLSIPASQLGPNDGLSVYVNASYANDANTKSVGTSLGSAPFSSASFTTSHSWAGIAGFRNRGSTGSQVTMLNNNNFGTGTSPSNLTTMSVNTAAAQNLVVNAQLTNAADYIVIQSVDVQFLPAIN